MKTTGKRWFAAVLMAAACLTALPAVRAEAAAQKAETRTISKTRFEKVKNSSENGFYTGSSGRSFEIFTFGDYVAICTGTDTQVNDTHYYDDPVLQITNNGTSYRNIVLEDFVQEKAKLPDDTEIAFYHVKTLNRNLYITGGYRYTDGEGDPRCQYFFLRAKTDKNLTFHKLGKNLTGDDFARWSNPAEFSWDLYLSMGKYVAAADSIRMAVKQQKDQYLKQDYGVYYVSGNLTSWKEKQIKQTQKLPKDKYPTVAFRPLYATPTGMIFMERQIYNDDYGDNWLIYTTNFSSYRLVKGVKAGNGCQNPAESMVWFDIQGSPDGRGSILTRYTLKNGKYSDLEYYRGVGLGSFKKTFTVNGSWRNYAWIATADWKKLCCYVREADRSSLYVGGITGSMTKYSTKLDARKIRLGDCDHDGNLYFVYDGRYLMASRDFGKNIYQIDTGIRTLTGCFVTGDRLVLVNSAGSDVSIPRTQVLKVMN